MLEKHMTGYPSIDKPWKKYYSPESINHTIPQCTVYSYLKAQCRPYAKNDALIYYGRRIRYSQLLAEIDKAAEAFAKLGVKKGDIVTICSMSIPEVVYAFYALNRLGAVSNMIDPRTNTERLAQYMQSAHSEIVVLLDKVLPRFIEVDKAISLKKMIVISPGNQLPLLKKAAYLLKNRRRKVLADNCMDWNSFIRNGGQSDCRIKEPEYEKDCPATIVYTGGTTGIPKGAVLSNDALNALTIEFMTNGMAYEPGQRFLDIMPPFIAYGIACGLNMPLAIGFTTILIPLFDPDHFDRLIMKYKPNHFVGVPAHYEKLISSPQAHKLDLSCIRTAAAGGDALIPESEEKINRFFKAHGCSYELVKGYGMTELGSSAVSTKDGANKPGSVGIPMPLNIVTVRDSQSQAELQYNQEGELYIASPTMMSTYINAPDELENVFWRDAYGVKWVKTGDIGYMDEDGFIFLKGRMKRMIIRPDGHNVWPSQIEAVISRHPAVKQCVVIGLPVPGMQNGKIPTAFIVTNPGVEHTDQLLVEIEMFSKEHMPERDTASDFKYISSIPMTSVGKIDFRALEEKNLCPIDS